MYFFTYLKYCKTFSHNAVKTFVRNFSQGTWIATKRKLKPGKINAQTQTMNNFDKYL